jgi:hypothetical protein
MALCSGLPGGAPLYPPKHHPRAMSLVGPSVLISGRGGDMITALGNKMHIGAFDYVRTSTGARLRAQMSFAKFRCVTMHA